MKRCSHMAVAQKTGTKMGWPGKWKHGPKPAVCPSWLILSHTHISIHCCIFSQSLDRQQVRVVEAFEKEDRQWIFELIGPTQASKGKCPNKHHAYTKAMPLSSGWRRIGRESEME